MFAFVLFGDFTPNPVIFSFDSFAVHWYGFFIALAGLFGLLIGAKISRRYNLPPNLFIDYAFYGLLGGLLGARLWHIVFELPYYLDQPFDIFKIWQGGLAIHGAILGGFLALFFYARRRHNNFRLLLDIFAPLLVLGQALGRLGNYFNSELYGLPTNLPWAIFVSPLARLSGYENYSYFHPLFLYESIWCFALFLLLLYLHQASISCRRESNISLPSKIKNLKSKIITSHGNIFIIYLLLYSLERFFIGFLRLDPQASFAGLRADQWVSLLIIAFVFIWFIKIMRSNRDQCL